MIHTSLGQISGLLSPFLEWRRNKAVLKIIDERITLLDIGCGRATLLKMLVKSKRKNIKYFGIDIIPEVIQANRKKYKKQVFFCMDVYNIDFLKKLKNKFDIITLIALIEHIPHPVQMLKVLKRILKNNGKIIITTPVKGSELIYKVGGILKLFSREAVAEHNSILFNKESLKEIAEKAGYDLIMYKTFLFRFNQLAVYSLKK